MCSTHRDKDFIDWADCKQEESWGVVSFRVAVSRQTWKRQINSTLTGSWWNGQRKLEFESAGWWQKPTRRARCKQSVHCVVAENFDKDSQWCNGVEEAGAQRVKEDTKRRIQNNSRFYDKPCGNTTVTMEKVRKAINFNAELKANSMWLWLTSEQIA